MRRSALILCPGRTVWAESIRVDKFRMPIYAVNHCALTVHLFDHLVVGDGELMPAFAAAARPINDSFVTHTVAVPKGGAGAEPYEADYHWQPHDPEGGSGLLAVQIALEHGAAHVYVAGCGFDRGWFYAPTATESHEHLREIWDRNRHWMRGRVETLATGEVW